MIQIAAIDMHACDNTHCNTTVTITDRYNERGSGYSCGAAAGAF